MVVATMVQQGNGKGAPHQPLTASVTTPKKSRRRRARVVLPKKFQDIIEVMYKVLVSIHGRFEEKQSSRYSILEIPSPW